MTDFHPIRVVCNYCGCEAELVTGRKVWPLRKDLVDLLVWSCEPCKAYATCKKGSNEPRGTLAKDSLRRLRVKCHKMMDLIWQDGYMTRTATYEWLQLELRLTKEKCHIAMFDNDICNRVLKLAEHKYGINRKATLDS